MNLNDAAAWDDSDLIHTWDEALEEYKKYHSIHLSGKRLEEVLTKEELAQVVAQRRALRQRTHGRSLKRYDNDEDSKDETTGDGEEKEMSISPEREIPIEVTLKEQQIPSVDQANAQGATQSYTPKHEAITASDTLPGTSLMIGVQDENLKNLLMAWYYAGYHTGLYEGREQARKELSKDATIR